MYYSFMGGCPRSDAPATRSTDKLTRPAQSRSVMPHRTSRLRQRPAGRGTAGLLAAALMMFTHAHAHAGTTHTTGSGHRGHAARTAQREPDDEAVIEPVTTGWRQVGMASFYGPRHHGRRTASGQRFDQEAMTAAHPWLPFGTRLLVTNKMTGQQVIVTVTDRGAMRRRIIDLSVAAARELGIIRQGVASVELTLI